MVKKIALSIGLIIAATFCGFGLFICGLVVAALVVTGGNIEYDFKYTDASGTKTFTNKQ